MIGGIVDADTTQCSDHDLPLRREAQPGDFVIREGVTVRFGMEIAGLFAGSDVNPVESPQRPDPYIIPGAQIRGGLVVFPDVNARQDCGHGQALVCEMPDLVEVTAQGDPRGSVFLDIVDPGHEAGVGHVAVQGVDQESVSLVGEGHPEKVVV